MIYSYLSLPAVQQLIHVTDANLTEWGSQDFHYTRTEPNLLTKLPAMFAKYRVLIYSGDADAQIPTLGTERWVTGLGLPALAGKGWRPWRVDGNTAGYVIEYDTSSGSGHGADGSGNNGEFLFMTVKAAGHMAPTYKRSQSLAMYQRFISGGRNYTG